MDNDCPRRGAESWSDVSSSGEGRIGYWLAEESEPRRGLQDLHSGSTASAATVSLLSRRAYSARRPQKIKACGGSSEFRVEGSGKVGVRVGEAVNGILTRCQPPTVNTWRDRLRWHRDAPPVPTWCNRMGVKCKGG